MRLRCVQVVSVAQAVDQAVAGASTVPPVVTGLVVFSPLILCELADASDHTN